MWWPKSLLQQWLSPWSSRVVPERCRWKSVLQPMVFYRRPMPQQFCLRRRLLWNCMPGPVFWRLFLHDTWMDRKHSSLLSLALDHNCAAITRCGYTQPAMSDLSGGLARKSWHSATIPSLVSRYSDAYLDNSKLSALSIWDSSHYCNVAFQEFNF